MVSESGFTSLVSCERVPILIGAFKRIWIVVDGAIRRESVFWPAIVLVNMPDSLQGSKILGNLPRKNSRLEFKQYKQYT